MSTGPDKFGIIIAIAITAGALAFAGSLAANPENRSLQPQGEEFIERTVEEVAELPSQAEQAFEELKEVPSELEETVEEVTEIDVTEPEEIVEEATEVLPEASDVVKQQQGELLELVTIPMGTSTPDCELSNECYIPATVTIKAGGEVIWTNEDTVPHTVTSGTASSGPTVLFDSGLLKSGETYSIELDIRGEYDYFCMVHPWMAGTIKVV